MTCLETKILIFDNGVTVNLNLKRGIAMNITLALDKEKETYLNCGRIGMFLKK